MKTSWKIAAAVVGAITVFCLICFIISAITGSSPQFKATATARAEMTANAPTQTPKPTYTPRPTFTPRPPTRTPGPTNTPRPTATPTPTPTPIVLSGRGDSVVDVEKFPGPAIVKITYTGGGNFVVKNYGADGDKIDLLVNEIGKYQGTLPLDFMDGEETARFEITASGSWEIAILPFESMRIESIPGTITGTGSDVFFLNGDNPDLFRIDAGQADGNFVIWTYSGTGRDLAVNEIAPYEGTVMAGSGTKVVVVTATGPWSIEVTTK